MNRRLLPFTLISGCLLALYRPSCAADLSFGLGYPYLSLKYDFKALAAEGRFVSGSGVRAYTGRGYWNFYQSHKLTGFTGLEGGYIKFNAVGLTGTGSEGALFVGGEYFAAEKLSFMMDFAPTLITLKSGNTDISRVEYVVNLGLYLHFGGLRPKAEAAEVPAEVPEVAIVSPPISNLPATSAEISAVPAAPEIVASTAPETLSVYTVPETTAPGKKTAGSEVAVWLARLKSRNGPERRKAAFELGKVKAVDAVGPLLELLHLWRITGPRVKTDGAGKSVLELLDEENAKTCAAAALALGRIGDSRALNPLIGKLEDGSAHVRASAAEGLGSLGDKAAISPLENALKDDSEEVRQAAEESLKKLAAQ